MTKIKRVARVEGNFAYIPLTRGYEAIIDREDLLVVGQHNWCAKDGRNTVYAFRGEGGKGKQVFYRLHREVLGDIPQGFVVDHIDGNGLNNTKANLRIVSNEQNTRNTTISKRNASGYKGVSFYKAYGRWSAKICVKGEQEFLGYFDTPEEAYAAYCEASDKFHGKYGRKG